MLDLNEIYFFVEVVKAGSFAEAARRLGMPANTISRYIQQLESDLKSRLILRTTRKLTLTAVGQTFYEQCAKNVRELVQAGQQAADTHPEPVGPLRVALNNDFFDIFPDSWVKQFLSSYPGVPLEFVVDNAYLDLTASGVDLALRREATLDENATRRVLRTAHRLLVASPEYIEARGAPTSLDELSQHDCLLISRDFGPSTWYLNGPDGRIGVHVQGRLQSSTSRPVRQAAVIGGGMQLRVQPAARADLRHLRG